MHIINLVNKNANIVFVDTQNRKVVRLNPGLKLQLGVK